MAWPFTNVGAPNLDTGPGTPIPTTLGVVAAGDCWLVGAHFTSGPDAGDPIIVTVYDTAGKILLQLSIPIGGEQPYEWPFRPVVGVKWVAGAVGLLGHVWGYQ